MEPSLKKSANRLFCLTSGKFMKEIWVKRSGTSYFLVVVHLKKLGYSRSFDSKSDLFSNFTYFPADFWSNINIESHFFIVSICSQSSEMSIEDTIESEEFRYVLYASASSLELNAIIALLSFDILIYIGPYRNFPLPISRFS